MKLDFDGGKRIIFRNWPVSSSNASHSLTKAASKLTKKGSET